MIDLLIVVLVAGYCAFLIRKAYKNRKEGKVTGCCGCGGNCGSCGGCTAPPENNQKKN